MAGGGNLVNAAGRTMSSTNNSVQLMASGGQVENSGTVSAGNGSVTLSGSAGVNHYGTISGGGGTVVLHASDSESMVYTGGVSQILNAGGTTIVSADKMSLNGSIDTSNGMVMLFPVSSIAIHVGTGSSDLAPATLELSSDELNLIQADKLIIGTSGSSGSGAVTVKSTIALPMLLSLQSASAITQESNALIATQAFEAIGSEVNLMEANPTGVVSGIATENDFRFRSTNLITVSFGYGAAGITVPSNKTIYLESDTYGVNQTYGSPLVGGNLAIKTPGTVFLDYPYNSISNVAADLYFGGAGTGSFSLLNSGSIAIDGMFYGITGITTNNQDVEIAVPSGGFTITENQPVVTGSGSKTFQFNGVLTGGMSTTTTTTSTSTTSTSTSSTSTTSTSSTSTSSTTSTSTTSTSSSSTTTTSTTSTTMPGSTAENAAVADALANKVTSTIVEGTSNMVPDVGTGPDKQNEKDKDKSRSNDAIVRDEKSGARKDEAAQKLYCN